MARTEKAILAFLSRRGGGLEAEDVVQQAANRLMKESYQKKETVIRELKEQFQLIEVQYNPLTLKLDGSGGDIELDNGFTSEENSVNQEINPGAVSLSMELVLDGEETRDKTMDLLQKIQYEVDKKVIFCWGNIVFPGELTQADAQFTMFSNTGMPQMGKVSLTIYQKSPEDNKYWKRAFKSCFQRI